MAKAYDIEMKNSGAEKRQWHQSYISMARHENQRMKQWRNKQRHEK